MEQQRLGRLGFSDAPPVTEAQPVGHESTISGPGYPLPLWIRFPADSASVPHKMDMLAWWLITTKDAAGITAFLDRPKSPNLKPRLDMCRAWIWLHRYSRAEITVALENLQPSESHPLRAALNCVREILRTHTEGKTYA